MDDLTAIYYFIDDFRKVFNEDWEKHLKKEFPKLISYSRFVHLMKNLFISLFAYLFHYRGKLLGISFVDSTKIYVFHNKRVSRNKVFKNLAKRGKTSTGWF
jgi:hypothetical protein